MTEKPRWANLSSQTKLRVVVMGIVQIALLATALWDIRRRPSAEIRGNKRMWMAISFINFVGPAAYFLFGRKAITSSQKEVLVEA